MEKTRTNLNRETCTIPKMNQLRENQLKVNMRYQDLGGPDCSVVVYYCPHSLFVGVSGPCIVMQYLVSIQDLPKKRARCFTLYCVRAVMWLLVFCATSSRCLG